MLSIIVCSKYGDLSAELKQNISATIGCAYELVVIDNSSNQYNIFQAYNEGVHRANGDILCFMHEDIIFHSTDWGKKVFSIFEEESIGMVGVIGSRYVPKTPASWWLCECSAGQIMQGMVINNHYQAPLMGLKIHDRNIDVAVVDGLWFCIPKVLFNQIQFDTTTFNSFHCYDIDISLQILLSGKRVVVARDILIEHLSLGNVVKSNYYEQLRICHKKWSTQLPIHIGWNLPVEVEQCIDAILKNYQRRVIDYDQLYHSRPLERRRQLHTWWKNIKCLLQRCES